MTGKLPEAACLLSNASSDPYFLFPIFLEKHRNRPGAGRANKTMVVESP